MLPRAAGGLSSLNDRRVLVAGAVPCWGARWIPCCFFRSRCVCQYPLTPLPPLLVPNAPRQSSQKDVLDDVPMYIGQSNVTAAEAVSQLLVVDPEQVQNGGVEIVYL